jgi:glycosyltransferase involved in cell wall biosynthesis
VVPGDPQALAEAINRILNSPELATKFAAGGRKLIENKFSAARMAAEYERLYLSLHHQGHEKDEVTEISPQRR